MPYEIYPVSLQLFITYDRPKKHGCKGGKLIFLDLKVKEKIENWTMRSVTVVTVLTFLAITTNAIPVANRLRFAKERAIGDPCGSGGTCKDESECGSEMKIAKSGLCPHDPANIKCCLTPRQIAACICRLPSRVDNCRSGGH